MHGMPWQHAPHFAEARVADEITEPDDPRLVCVGRLIVDERRDGIGTLTVLKCRTVDTSL
jgi:hypothetical protein